MAQLAIKGHPTRGDEVIEILKMLGGKNIHNYGGTFNECYTIDNNKICTIYTSVAKIDNFVIFTLEQFEEKYPYKVGDKVLHNLDIVMLIERMYWDSECNIIRYDIVSQVDEKYKLKGLMAEHLQLYTEQKEETMEDKGTLEQIDLTRELRIADEVEVILGDYEFVLKDGKTYFVKKKPTYPKTYVECCECLSLGEDSKLYTKGYKASLIQNFQQLLICRDAWWKMADDWKPDWNEETNKFTISNKYNQIYLNNTAWYAEVLSFPTAEMRDVFYENFKELINKVKELL